MTGIMPAMHYVTETLLVGNLEDVQQPPAAVTAVLFLADHHVTPPPGLVYTQIPLKEFGEADPNDVKRAVDWLEAHARQPRLMVCCRAGMGRSVSMVIAYLCCVKGMSYTDAVRLAKERRPGATPLPNLEQTIEKVRQLREKHGKAQAENRTPAPGHSDKSSRAV
jgi:protein-tyrosine phosphatase